MVPQLAIATAKGGCLSMEPEKMRPIAGNDRPFLISPCGSVVEALGVCGKGLRRTVWEPLMDLGAPFIACVTSFGTCNTAYLPRTPSPISGNSPLLVFKNEYLEKCRSRGRTHCKKALRPSDRPLGPAPNAPESRRHHLTQTREHVADAIGAGGCPERAKGPVRGQCCGDSSQAAAHARRDLRFRFHARARAPRCR